MSIGLGRRFHRTELERVVPAVLEVLAPGASRIEVKGSWCRGAASIGDLEILATPTIVERAVAGAQVSLFETAPVHRVNRLWEIINGADWMVPVNKAGDPDPHWPSKRLEGSKQFKIFLPKVRCFIDLYMREPAGWGVISVFRTGPELFSKGVATHALYKVEKGWRQPPSRFQAGAKRTKGPWRMMDGFVRRNGVVVPTLEEIDVFTVLELCWVRPEYRQGWRDVTPMSRPLAGAQTSTLKDVLAGTEHPNYAGIPMRAIEAELETRR